MIIQRDDGDVLSDLFKLISYPHDKISKRKIDCLLLISKVLKLMFVC